MQTMDLGQVIGPPGPQGERGPAGPQGPVGVIADGSVNTDKLADSAVTTPKIAASSVTWDKLSVEARHSNPNLLDNWYFVGGGSQQGGGQFPINQRGETEYTTPGYTIDRWVISNKNTTNYKLEVTDKGVKLFTSEAGGNVFFSQSIESFSKYTGKKLTVSFLFDDNLLSTTIDIPINIPTHNTQLKRVVFDHFEIEMWYSLSNNSLLIQTNTLNITELTLIAAKLELGPVQTLAHQDADGNWVLNDPPPNFQQELVKCMRYQQIIFPYMAHGRYGVGPANADGNTYIFIPLIVPLRATPTISTKGSFGIWNSTTAYPVYDLMLDRASNNGITLMVRSTGQYPFSVGEYFQLIDYGDLTSRIIIDANL